VIACLFCREREIACGAPAVGSVDTTCRYVGAPLVLIGDIGKLTSGLASTHGGHASVNIKQRRNMVFISVVTTMGVSIGNSSPRTQVCADYDS
jgi:hypothetical protein